MKKVYLAGLAAMLFLGSCGGGTNSDALSETLSDSEDIQEAVESFRDGGARNGNEYFSGILSEVVGVDVKFKEIVKLDEIDASEAQFNAVLDSANHFIKEGRKALDLYKNESWPLRAEYHDLTLEWFSSVETCINDYLYDLAEPMSRPDDTWTNEELDFYEEYLTALDTYYEVDQRWVEYQEVYAAANGFEMGGVIDEDAMVEEQMEHDVAE